MTGLDLDAWEERAAIMEYCGEMSRFEAETLAAEAQGFKRHEVINEVRKRDIRQGRNNGQEMARKQRQDDLPRMQSDTKEKG